MVRRDRAFEIDFQDMSSVLRYSVQLSQFTKHESYLAVQWRALTVSGGRLPGRNLPRSLQRQLSSKNSQSAITFAEFLESRVLEFAILPLGFIYSKETYRKKSHETPKYQTHLPSSLPPFQLHSFLQYNSLLK